MGFTIKESADMIDAWYGKKFSKKEKLQLLDAKLFALEQKLKEIKAMKKLIGEFKDDVLNNRC